MQQNRNRKNTYLFGEKQTPTFGTNGPDHNGKNRELAIDGENWVNTIEEYERWLGKRRIKILVLGKQRKRGPKGRW